MKYEIGFPWIYRIKFDVSSNIDNIFDNSKIQLFDIDKMVDNLTSAYIFRYYCWPLLPVHGPVQVLDNVNQFLQYSENQKVQDGSHFMLICLPAEWISKVEIQRNGQTWGVELKQARHSDVTLLCTV